MVGARCLLAELDELLKLDQAIRILVRRRGREEKKIRRGRHAQMIPILGDSLITKRVGARLDRLASIVRSIGTVHDYTNEGAVRESGVGSAGAPGSLGQYFSQPELAKGSGVAHNSNSLGLECVAHTFRHSGVGAGADGLHLIIGRRANASETEKDRYEACKPSTLHEISDCRLRIMDCGLRIEESTIRNPKAKILPGECSDKSATFAENPPLPVEARSLEFIGNGVRRHRVGQLRERRIVRRLVAANMILVAQGPGLNPRQPAG